MVEEVGNGFCHWASLTLKEYNLKGRDANEIQRISLKV